MANILSKRFAELIEQANQIEATKKETYDSYTNRDKIEIKANDYLNWDVKAKHLIRTACGEDSEHYKAFMETTSFMSTMYGNFARKIAIFKAAQEDFDGGLLVSNRNLIESEVFSQELDQAMELLGKGYLPSAAVIAGTVLETALRTLCAKHNLPPGKLDKMNADLAKAGAYNLLEQKRITALAQIRNDAAHGKNDQFNQGDVESMIQDVERFLANHLK